MLPTVAVSVDLVVQFGIGHRASGIGHRHRRRGVRPVEEITKLPGRIENVIETDSGSQG